MRLSTEEIAVVTDGRRFGPVALVDGMAYDSRRVKPGQLFVALRGERDGHDWIDTALAAGATAYLTERDPIGGSAIQVADTPSALATLARSVRDRFGSVVAITGSVGKTTTKDLVSAVLGRSFTTHASLDSYNNLIGVPHTMLTAPDGTEALVVEVGANAPGEIRRLCSIALPNIGVVTRVVEAHTQGFGGTLAAVAKAKSEMVESLSEKGTAVLNADDPLVAAMAGGTSADVLFFGHTGDVQAEVLSVDCELRPLIRFRTPWGDLDVRLSARGAHQLTNAAAAVAVGGIHNVPMAEIGHALEVARLSGRRMDLRTNPDGVVVLDDSYNANPASVEAALHALSALPGRRHVAVLGFMAELGELEAPQHHRIGDLTRQLGLEAISVGGPDYGIPNFSTIDDALTVLADLGEGDVVLVKGSRVAGLDTLARRLMEPSRSATPT